MSKTLNCDSAKEIPEKGHCGLTWTDSAEYGLLCLNNDIVVTVKAFAVIISKHTEQVFAYIHCVKML